jgi:hypothetical protein
MVVRELCRRGRQLSIQLADWVVAVPDRNISLKQKSGSWTPCLKEDVIDKNQEPKDSHYSIIQFFARSFSVPLRFNFKTNNELDNQLNF